MAIRGGHLVPVALGVGRRKAARSTPHIERASGGGGGKLATQSRWQEAALLMRRGVTLSVGLGRWHGYEPICTAIIRVLAM